MSNIKHIYNLNVMITTLNFKAPFTMDHHINSKNESVFIALYIFSFLFSVIALTYLRFDNIPQIYVLFIVISTPIYFFVSLFLRCASIYDFRITNLLQDTFISFIVLLP